MYDFDTFTISPASYLIQRYTEINIEITPTPRNFHNRLAGRNFQNGRSIDDLDLDCRKMLRIKKAP